MVVKYSSDGVCRFYEKSHKYKVGNENYLSVTQLVHKQFPAFNEKKTARWLASLPFAKKQKKGVKYWLNEWARNRDEGTLIHAEIETLINSPEQYPTLKPVLHPRTVIALDGFEKFHRRLDEPMVTTEALIYNKDFKVAGQVDCIIAVNGEDGDKELIIFDWKATKDISFKYKYSNPEEAHGITVDTSDMPNCNGSLYTIQLSIYAYLLELQGNKIKELMIGHICPKTNSLVIIPITYLRDTAQSILEDRKLFMSLEGEI